METGDFLDAEVGVSVAITAAVLSPSVRRVLRRGAIYGLAGLLMARDAAASFGRGMARGVQAASPSLSPTTEDGAGDSQNTA